ncbi:hypothetical protein TCCBUS3UF1_740 [Thermus sp. CCB_US3_UF1]|nr:hypothetical protein TCCBUS3UF1_740 [Thermus sp. CCB_US3_UF1]
MGMDRYSERQKVTTTLVNPFEGPSTPDTLGAEIETLHRTENPHQGGKDYP